MDSGSSRRAENWRPLALLLVMAIALLCIVIRLLPSDMREFNFAPAGALMLFAGRAIEANRFSRSRFRAARCR